LNLQAVPLICDMYQSQTMEHHYKSVENYFGESRIVYVQEKRVFYFTINGTEANLRLGADEKWIYHETYDFSAEIPVLQFNEFFGKRHFNSN